MCIPAKHKFVQAVHKFGNKFVHRLHKFVHLCNMEMLHLHFESYSQSLSSHWHIYFIDHVFLTPGISASNSQKSSFHNNLLSKKNFQMESIIWCLVDTGLAIFCMSSHRYCVQIIADKLSFWRLVPCVVRLYVWIH